VGSIDWARRLGWKFDPGTLSSGEGTVLDENCLLLRLMPGGWFYQNMVTISQLHQDHALTLLDERARRITRIEENDRPMDTLGRGPFTIFARELFPAVGNAAIQSVRVQAYVDAARVACAVERHRIAHGALPDALPQLVPRFLDHIPADVLDGQPLRYRRPAEGGYVVYSVGWNRIDDGGKVGWTSGPKPSLDLKTGDWVWSLPR
jgi:hypothetical protein